MFFYEFLTLVDTPYPTLTPQFFTTIIISFTRHVLTLLTFSSYLYLKDYLTGNIMELPFTSVFEYQTFAKNGLVFQTDTTPVIWFTIKVVLSICLLITIRGGVPRYRYDFLTKLGWVKFLTLVVTLFYITFMLKLFC